jgi:hypothetical protein
MCSDKRTGQPHYQNPKRGLRYVHAEYRSPVRRCTVAGRSRAPPITDASGITTMDKLIDKAVRMGVHSAFAPIFRLCG